MFSFIIRGQLTYTSSKRLADLSANRRRIFKLSPGKGIRDVCAAEFRRMATIDVPLEELETTREILIERIHTDMTSDERRFLASFKGRNPEWKLLGMDEKVNISALPSVQWKLYNLQQMPDKKHGQALDKLKKILEL